MTIELGNLYEHTRYQIFSCSMCDYRVTAVLFTDSTPGIEKSNRGVLAVANFNFTEHNQAKHSGDAQMKQL